MAHSSTIHVEKPADAATVTPIEGGVAPFNVTPAAALQWFRSKGLKVSFSHLDLLTDAYTHAFTVAKMLDVDMLSDVAKALEEAIEGGETVKTFREKLFPMLQARGWWGRRVVTDPLTGEAIRAQLGSAARLNTIFRTNMQTAYAEGKWIGIIEGQNDNPFLIYDAVDDHRTRPEHAALDDLVFPVDHPFWDTHYPPNGYNCRCTAIPADADTIEALGLEVSDSTPRQSRKTRKWKNPRTGETVRVPLDQDPGWNHNPGKETLRLLDTLLKDKLSTLPKDFQLNGLSALELVKMPKDQLDAFLDKHLAAVTAAADTPDDTAKAAARRAAEEVARLAGKG